jgi:hypothetical protein
MMPPVIFGAGLVIGTGTGLLMGQDLAKCTERMVAGENRAWLAFGLFRRMAMMTVALGAGLLMGKPGAVGVAVGVGIAFFAYVGFRARRKA